MKALCTEAAVRALRRRYPQIYKSDKKLRVDPKQISVEIHDFEEARNSMLPAAHRSSVTPAKPLGPSMQALLGQTKLRICKQVRRIFPPAVDAGVGECEQDEGQSSAAGLTVRLPAGSAIVQRPRLLLCGEHGAGQVYLGPALLNMMETFPTHSICTL